MLGYHSVVGRCLLRGFCTFQAWWRVRVVAVLFYLISTPQFLAQLLTALIASCKRVAAVVVYSARVQIARSPA